MGEGNGRRKPRDHKYAEVVISRPKTLVGLHGRHREVYPDQKPPRHGKPVEKIEREDRWQ